ncbi:uncharacterized protein LOC114270632 isoform X2 [Camellia sinensis]|nr:uncharacterized protein LOC114270632 isoform X2 [Camellia sinensis]
MAAMIRANKRRILFLKREDGSICTYQMEIQETFLYHFKSLFQKSDAFLLVQELHSKEVKSSSDSYLKGLTILKVFTYFLLFWWFWGVPVAFMYKKLVEPFG